MIYYTTDEVFRVWHEKHADLGNEYIRLEAFFNKTREWGVIEVIFLNPATSHYASDPQVTNPRLDLVIVPSRDYRDTISRAQELWNENLEDYQQKVFDLKEVKSDNA